MTFEYLDDTLGAMKLHFCEHTKTWVGGAVEDCAYHKRLDKTRPPVLGANTLEKK